MRAWRIGLTLAIVMGGANAQTPEGQYRAFRGIAPFAGADVSWFGRNGQQDKLTFYSYWTGYRDADAKLHWVVRRDTGTQANVAVIQFGDGLPPQGRDVPAQPARPGPTTWLWSDACPALTEAMSTFEAVGKNGFSAKLYPPERPQEPDADKVVVMSADYHSMTFWAQLPNARIETRGPMPGDGAGAFIYRIIRIFDDGGCTMTAEPEIPKPTG